MKNLFPASCSLAASLLLAIGACASDDAESVDGATASDDGGTTGGGTTDGAMDATSADSADSDTGTPGEDSDTDAPPLSGEELFLAVCAACHGAEGEGTMLAYELRHPNRAHATWVIRNGRPGLEFPNAEMAVYPPEMVSDAQIEEIFDYLDSFPQPDTAEDLYLDYCGNCHGSDPRTGGAVGESPIDENRDDIVEEAREGNGGTDYGNRTAYMPPFSSDRLNDAELEMIADWLLSL